MSIHVRSLPEGHPYRLFRNFARMVWDHLQLPPPTPIQLDFCDYLQYGPEYLQIQAFRGAGKTYFTAAYCCWCLFLNPNELVLIISAAKDTSDQICRFTRRLIEDIEELHDLRPNVLRGDQDSAVSFTVGNCIPAKTPSVSSKGITGTITGGRASKIILDDVEVTNNSETPMMREKLVTRLEEISAILLPADDRLGVDPKVRVLGTPQSTHTIYRVLEERGYESRVWPIAIPDDKTAANYGINPGSGEPRLAKLIRDMPGKPGDSTEPTRFTAPHIAGLRKKFGAASFQRQFMLATDLSDADRFPLKIKDLMFDEFPETSAREVYIHSNHPQHRLGQHENPGLPGDGFYAPGQVEGSLVPFEKTVMSVDPSGRGSDETGIAVVSALSGYQFVHSVRGLPGGYSLPTLEAIAREAKRYNVNTVVVESNMGDGAILELLKPVMQRVHPCELVEVRSSKQKEIRILETLSPIWESHRAIFHPRVIQQQESASGGDSAEQKRVRQLFWSATHLEEAKGCLPYDDRIDALEMACRLLVDTLARNAHEAQRGRDLDDLNEWIKEYDPPGTAGERTWCSLDL